LETAQEQRERLQNTTIAAAALLGVFAMFATTTGLLLRAELASQEQRRIAESRARFLAYHDPLTQLSNRTLFAEQTAPMTEIGRTPIFFLIDLDDFQAVNDSFGHGVGDALLVAMADRIRKFTEKRNGVAARLGGDEFALMLPHHGDLSSAQALCLELVARVTQLFQVNEISFTPSASIGVVRGDVLISRSMSDILTSADLALFEAKRNSQSDFVIYDEDLAQKAQYRREIKDAVSDALTNGEFELHFQPQIHLETGRLHGFEALVRWRRNGILLQPNDFIPILEETGHIRLVDLWVLRKAVVTAAQWLEIRRRPIAVSVNLSPLHFQFDDIVGHVKQVLKATALPPHFLTLEITETVLLDNWDKVTRTMAELSALGVCLSLDDFGTGYSSLAYLRNLKVNELKIDRAFLIDIEASTQTKIVLNSIVDIAKGLGMSIVVEGIETLEQRDIVRGFGAHTGQGFLFGRPMSKDKIIEIITSETKIALDWNKKAEASFGNVSARVA
jgi:diguanylate cyclase (GGDEF)-like protein